MSDLERAKELEIAWCDYCVTNRLIAYGEVPELTEARCKEQLEKDCERIRRKYEHT